MARVEYRGATAHRGGAGCLCRAPWPRALAGAGVAIVAMVGLAVPAAAQDRFELFPFASMNGSIAGTPALLGASLTTFGGSLGGMLGVRAGGAYDLRALGGASTTGETERGWVADVDAVISPGRLPVIGPLLGGFLPTFFTGVGVQGVRRDAGASSSTMVTSYGFGVSRSLGALALETEARRRVPVTLGGASAECGDWRRGWEYRVGVKIGFGGRSTPTSISGIPLPAGSGSARGERSPAPAAAARSSAVLATAEGYLGTRYRYGGDSPSEGFDCSGYVQYVFRRHGVSLPRTSRQQAEAGVSLPARLADIREGDLLFFSQTGARVDHVAIYTGRGRILHATASGGGVRYDDLDSPRGRWFAERLVAARRVLGEGAAFADPVTTGSLDPRLDPPDSAPKPR